MLTPEQIAYYETFGFLVLPQLFSKDETDALREASNRTMRKLRGGGLTPERSPRITDTI